KMKYLFTILGAAGTAAVMSTAPPVYGWEHASISSQGRFGAAQDTDGYGAPERDQFAALQSSLPTGSSVEQSGIAGPPATAMQGTQGVAGFRARLTQRLTPAS